MTIHTHDDVQKCCELLGHLNDYLDGELAQNLCRDLEQHIAECHDCQAVFDTLNQTIALYHSLGATPVALPAEVEARLLQQLGCNK
jgi:predicted anti-sigma-YlaC factor YlaD